MRFKVGPVRNLEKVQAYLKTVPRGAMRPAVKAFAIYVMGDEGHGLKHYEPYKYVSRAKAYGQTFQSEKQRRWFWANGGPDMIGDNRTGATAAAWRVRETKGGYGATIDNPTAGAYFTRSDSGQAAQLGLVGWRKTLRVVHDNMAGGIRAAVTAVNAFLRSKGR